MMIFDAKSAFSLHEIKEQAGQFRQIDLSEMERVKLMNRTDTKFVLPLAKLTALLASLREEYRILEIDGNRMMRYETLYYDTPELDLYHAHRMGRPNRYKVRQRHYVESDKYFTEVKHKTPKGRTIKHRMEHLDSTSLIESLQDNLHLGEESRCFVGVYSTVCPAELFAKLWVGYQRLTLVSNTSAERLTLDVGLTFKTHSQKNRLGTIVIAELKQDSRQPSVFLDLMKQQGVRSGSVSKYCLGMISLYQPLRHNRFKPQLRQLQKIATL